jgi:carbonic anhydrase
MTSLSDILSKNQAWASATAKADPALFPALSKGQAPEILWIGCADSRVPAAQVLGAGPGDVFVHRNVANLVVHTDFNSLSVIQYAIEVLKVKHVIVCGHTSCGGVTAAMGDHSYGLIDNWLRHIKDVYAQHRDELEAIEDDGARADALSRLNVAAQVRNLAHTPIAQKAWRAGQELTIHGLIYKLHDGVIDDLDCAVSGPDQLASPYPIGV